jgi:hypothetical protein
MTSIFIIDDGLNTSYIDTVLVALYYNHTHLNEMLINLPEESKFTYLQEIIKNDIIKPIRKNFSITSSTMNEIRNYSFICGWKNNSDITELFNPIDYMSFLINGFGSYKIKYDVAEISTKTQSENIMSIELDYIQSNVTYDTNVKTLLDDWKKSLSKKTAETTSHYKFIELPMLIPIYINRHSDGTQINNCKIDITQKIKFTKNNDTMQSDASWSIHSIICFSKINGGHYYSIINTNENIWYIFNNLKIPSLSPIDMYNDNNSNRIKQECVVILYRLDDEICKF